MNASNGRGLRRWQAVDRIASAAVFVAGAALLGLVLVQAWQVIARYALNDSPSWTEPATLVLLSTAMGFGAAAGVHARSHFAFGLLVQAATPALQRLMATLSHLIMAGIGAAIAWWSARLFVDGLDVAMAGAPLPQSAVFAPLALSGALMTLFGLCHLWRAWRSPEGTP